jgi:hypothetical protein
MKITVKVESELQSNNIFKKCSRKTVKEASAESEDVFATGIVNQEAAQQRIIEDTAITLLRALKQR